MTATISRTLGGFQVQTNGISFPAHSDPFQAIVIALEAGLPMDPELYGTLMLQAAKLSKPTPKPAFGYPGIGFDLPTELALLGGEVVQSPGGEVPLFRGMVNGVMTLQVTLSAEGLLMEHWSPDGQRGRTSTVRLDDYPLEHPVYDLLAAAALLSRRLRKQDEVEAAARG